MNQYSARRQSIVSPEDQSATFIELFFDLIFVFSVTQVVGLLHGGLTWSTFTQAILIFWLVWWAWTQFTWALNAADTTYSWVEIGTLLATAVAFFMAITLPDAFHTRAIWFGGAYVLVRLIGLALYSWVSWADETQRSAVRIFGLVSLAGLLSVLIGAFLGGQAQYWFWGLTILLDIVAAAVGGQQDGWDLHPEHFSERHGLFIIIALGETLIVAGAGVTGEMWTGNLILAAILAVSITCGLWWSYFPRSKPLLEHALASVHGSAQASMARDVFSLLHFPMIFGVIAYAFAIEEIIAHPADPLPFTGRLALALGLILFVGVMAAAIWRATGSLPCLRVGLILVTAVMILLVANVSPLLTLLMALLGVFLIAIYEQQQSSDLVKSPV